MPNPRLAAEQKTFARVISLVARGFKADGFVRKGRAFNRRTPSGVVHVLGFQKFAPSSPGVVAFTGGQDLAGRFCINFDVVVPQVYAATHEGRPVPSFVPPAGFFLGGRLRGFVGHEEGNSLGRPAEEVAQDVWRVYESDAVPLFDECSTCEGVVAHLERGGLLRRGNGHLAAEAYGYCLAAIGQRDRAAAVLQGLVDAASAKGPKRADDPYTGRIVAAAKREFGIELRA